MTSIIKKVCRIIQNSVFSDDFYFHEYIFSSSIYVIQITFFVKNILNASDNFKCLKLTMGIAENYDLKSIDSFFLINLLENLPKLESIDLSPFSRFFECSSFQSVLSVIEKFHKTSLKSLGIFTELLYDCDSIDILRKFKYLTTVTTEDFTLKFGTHD